MPFLDSTGYWDCSWHSGTEDICHARCLKQEKRTERWHDKGDSPHDSKYHSQFNKLGNSWLRQYVWLAYGKLQLLGQQNWEEAEIGLKSCKEFIERGLEVGSLQQILSEKKHVIEGMKVVSKQIEPVMFQPVEETNIMFTENKMAAKNIKSKVLAQ